MSGPEDNSSKSQKEWNDEILKGQVVYEEQRLKLLPTRNETLEGRTIVQGPRCSRNGAVSSKPFVTFTWPRFLGNVMVENTRLLQRGLAWKGPVEDSEKSTASEEDASGNGIETANYLLPRGATILRTITTTCPLRVENPVSCSKYKETSIAKSEKRAYDKAQGTAERAAKLSPSSFAFGGTESTSDEEVRSALSRSEFSTDTGVQNKGISNAEGSLEKSKKQVSLKDNSMVESMRNSKAEFGKGNESEYSSTQSQWSRKTITETIDDLSEVDNVQCDGGTADMLKHGELICAVDPEEESSASMSNSETIEALNVLEDSRISNPEQGGRMNGSVETCLSVSQENKYAASREKPPCFGDNAWVREEKLCLREIEGEEFFDKQILTAEITLSSDSQQTKLNPPVEDNMYSTGEKRKSEQLRQDIGLLSEANRMKRRLDIAYGASQNITKIIKFLMKAMYVLLMLTIVTTGRVAKVWATIFLACFSNNAQLRDEKPRLREAEGEESCDNQKFTAETMLASDSELTEPDVHVEDNTHPKRKKNPNGQLQTGIGPLAVANAMKRRIAIAYGVLRNPMKIIKFLVNAMYVLLMLTIVTTGGVAKVCATILLLVQAVCQWLNNKGKNFKEGQVEKAEHSYEAPYSSLNRR